MVNSSPKGLLVSFFVLQHCYPGSETKTFLRGRTKPHVRNRSIWVPGAKCKMRSPSPTSPSRAALGPNPHWTHWPKRKQMEPAVADGSIHSGCWQYQRNCPQLPQYSRPVWIGPNYSTTWSFSPLPSGWFHTRLLYALISSSQTLYLRHPYVPRVLCVHTMHCERGVPTDSVPPLLYPSNPPCYLGYCMYVPCTVSVAYPEWILTR